MSENFPPKVAAEILQVLEWIDAHPGGRWDDMGDLLAMYQRWRDIIRGNPPLLDDCGTMHTVPGLSSYGRIFIRRAGSFHGTRTNGITAVVEIA